MWAPAVLDAGGRAFVGTEDAELLCIDISGERLWSQKFDGALEAAAVLDAEGALYAVTGNGIVVKFT